MYADLARTLIPASALQQVAAHGRRVLESNQRLMQWQLDQATALDKQVASLRALSLDAVRAQGEAAFEAWSAALDALAAPDQAADDAA